MMQLLVFMTSLLYSLRMLFVFAVFIIILSFLGAPALFFLLRWKYSGHKSKNRTNNKLRVAIFHPYCNAGGGGEKVLWVALAAMKKRYPHAEFFIYTGDVEVTPDEILRKVKTVMNVDLDASCVKFIYMTKRRWLEPERYPYFTLLGQCLGSIYLGFEALAQLNPDVFIETTGYAFTLPLFKYIAGCKTGCYVHYPTITSEMLRRVANRTTMYNNRGIIARSPFLTTGKLFYYRMFAWLYYLAGQASDTTLVNSTFTLEHLTTLWNRPLHRVYPPCDVSHLKTIKRENKLPEKIRIFSLAQFRPEKDHALQVQALYELREIVPEELFSRITLVLCGSCRNIEDASRVKDLMDLSKHFSLENHVEFRVNVKYEELLKELEKAFIGIHTMYDEHFGIAVVEMMAAGLITVAHRSAGPLLDIIETSEASRLGFLAITAQEYAHTLKYILYMGGEEMREIRERARASVERFSRKKFQEEFLRAIDPIFK